MTGTSNRNTGKQRKTFPKEGEAKLKDTIQKLKARNRYLEKKQRFYESKLLDFYGNSKILPVRTQALNSKQNREDARRRILQMFNESIKKEKGSE